ncbi:hypothetical protein BFU36_11075 [Sulfolobus sp. A20]|nr:hypothetical protein BFU36_11075 [Sulfolobus sp. A20]TRM74280.1 hypothetical protein DJ532_13235 [Sulfolobus sp. A20-N-F8]TRM77202.1 hypothetical protein DJ528_07135 [Sulfolobus sp. B5]TRM83982.1 hypothetical protein DJ531_02785 [Sulfolobus sp. A20-N-F6]TRM86329.1 hypothetical protein DJ521_05800 [Sulfolobus sp. E3]TRM86341.1 hypothetical protein DJ529_11530 [Sulfolobus sp. C3]TRM92172.1 hypothetical protein DJ526_06095 [Sulfolobus sp. A20-N-G8]TRM97809.1 hypothetical protein DJ527_11585 
MGINSRKYITHTQLFAIIDLPKFGPSYLHYVLSLTNNIYTIVKLDIEILFYAINHSLALEYKFSYYLIKFFPFVLYSLIKR